MAAKAAGSENVDVRSTELPRRIAIRSQYNSKLLSFVNDDPRIHGFLRFSAEQVVSPFTNYQLEPANGSASRVHIRCSYNNKYLRREVHNGYWILAAADEPNEDTSQWSCTLFEPAYLNEADPTQGLRFRHVQSSRYACLWRTVDPLQRSCLYAGSSEPDRDSCDVLTLIDLDRMVILPRHVSFIGLNGLYLDSGVSQGQNFLRFSSPDPNQTPGALNEVFITNNGTAVIKNAHYGMFWRRTGSTHEWIWGDGSLDFDADHSSPIDNTKINNDLLFEPIMVGDHRVALRNLGNNLFCKRFTWLEINSGLQAGVTSVADDQETNLQVLEAIVSREIYDVEYHIQDARIYNQDQVPVTILTLPVVNPSPQPHTSELNFSVPDIISSTWSGHVPLRVGTAVNLQAGVPIIAKGNVEIGTKFSGSYTWGKDMGISRVLEIAHPITVPPRSTMTIKVTVIRGYCDVPFSYTQRDLLTTGETVTYEMHDGIYTGINAYDINYVEEVEPLAA